MKETNLFSLPNTSKRRTKDSKRQISNTSSEDFRNIDHAFSTKSAQDFINSLVLGNLYQELRPKKRISKTNVIPF